MKYWSKSCDLPSKDLLQWAKLSTRKYHKWLKRYGKINSHYNVSVTMAKYRVIVGSRSGRNKRFLTSTTNTHWKVTED